MEVSPRLLAPLARRIRNLVNRATLGLVDDTKTMQSLQVDATAQETLDAVEHWQGYGFTAHPHPGGEVLLLSVGGKRAVPIAVAVADRRYRLTGLAQGEVAIHDDLGQSIILRRTGIEIAGHLTLSGNLTLTGDIILNGTLTGTGDVIASGVSLVHHVHDGVTPGGGVTGEPV